MCNKGHNWCRFLFGAFIIVFTFVYWAAAKWIIFAIGILMIFHALFGNKYYCKNDSVVPKKKVKKKRK